MPNPRKRWNIRSWGLLAGVLFALFASPAGAVATPPQVTDIVEPAEDAAPLHPADVHMVAEFADTDGDEHVCTDWEIRVEGSSETVWQAFCATDVEKVHIHLGDGDFVNALSGHSELDFNQKYELRVRFFDDGGEWSEWAERGFETKSPGAKGKDAQVPWKARPGYEVEKVATGFQLPVNIAMVPSPGPHAGDPLFYVAELYGAVKVVHRDGTVADYATGLLNFNPTGNFPGSGEMGLAGLAVDPASGDLFATVVYEDESSLLVPKPHYAKVVRLHSDDRGLSATGETTVLDLVGENQGPSHQISHVEVMPGGVLMVHVGDGGAPLASRNLESFRGKILRMDFDGEPLPDNPFFDAGDGTTAKDYVWASGFRNPFGGALRVEDGAYFEVENGPTTDRLARVVSGTDYMWQGNNDAMTFGASFNWTLPHAPVNIDFVEFTSFEGSGFPPFAMGHAFVTESGPTYANGPQGIGKRVVEFDLASDGTNLAGPTPLVEYTGTGRATAVGLAAGEGGLYFTDLYKDQDYSSPIDPGANVLRIRWCGTDCPEEETEEPKEEPVVEVTPVDEGYLSIHGFHLTRKRFSAGRGTAFLYELSTDCTVRIRLRSLETGRRAGLGAPGRAGHNRRMFRGRVGKWVLAPGPYLATIVARSHSNPEVRRKQVRFEILPGA